MLGFWWSWNLFSEALSKTSNPVPLLWQRVREAIIFRLIIEPLVRMRPKHLKRNLFRTISIRNRAGYTNLFLDISFDLSWFPHTTHIVLLIVLLNCDRVSDKLSILIVCCRLCIGMLSYRSLECGLLPGWKLGFDGRSNRKVVFFLLCSDIIEPKFTGYLDDWLSDAGMRVLGMIRLIWSVRFIRPIGSSAVF
jgi:hypothetical protein